MSHLLTVAPEAAAAAADEWPSTGLLADAAASVDDSPRFLTAACSQRRGTIRFRRPAPTSQESRPEVHGSAATTTTTTTTTRRTGTRWIRRRRRLREGRGRSVRNYPVTYVGTISRILDPVVCGGGCGERVQTKRAGATCSAIPIHAEYRTSKMQELRPCG